MALIVSTQPIGALGARSSPDVGVGPAPTVATYRRRQLVALLAAATTALLLVAAVGRAAATFRDVPASVSGRRPVPASTSGDQAAAADVPLGPSADVATRTFYVAQPGDTFWSIARRLQPDVDVRALVDAIVRVNGGAALDVGQRVVVP